MSNPILRKEVLTSLRTRKALGMQAVYLLVLIALVYALWPAGGLQSLGGLQAKQLLMILSMGQLVLMMLFAPAFTSTSLTIEKERNTFESLFATRLSPWEIAVGKMAGSLTFLLLLAAMGTPMLAGLFLLGGVDGVQVLGVTSILVVTALYLGSIGLLVSTLMHRSYRSIIVTYAILLTVCVLFAMPAWPASDYMISRAGPNSGKILHVLASLSPLQGMMSLVMPGTATQGAPGMPVFWKLYLVAATLVFLGVGGFLLYKLHRPFAPPRPRERLRVIERGKITARSFLFLFDPAKRKPMIRFWQNPVAIKEFRTRPMLQIQWLLRAAAVCLMVSLGLMVVVSLAAAALVQEGLEKVPGMLGVVAGLEVVVIMLVGPALSAGSICSDRETSVWDLMCNSRLRSWTIVSGKFQASIIPLVLMIVAMTPALMILAYLREGMWPNIIRSLEVIGTTSLFVVVLGMFFSSMAKRTGTATAWTYGVVVALGVVTLLVLLGGDRFDVTYRRAMFLPNPLTAVLDAAGVAGFRQYQLFQDHMYFILSATAAMFVATVARVWQLRQPA